MLNLFNKYTCDKRISRAICNGDSKAFRALYDKYHQQLACYSINMGMTKEDTECIIQEVFISIWKNRQTLDENLSLKSYLYTITKRKVIKKIKRKIVEDNYLSHPENFPSYHQETEEYIIFSNLLDHAHAGLDMLPHKQKQIFMLSRQQGLTNDEIATRLNVSRRTVENQIYRATCKLKKHLGSDLIEK